MNASWLADTLPFYDMNIMVSSLKMFHCGRSLRSESEQPITSTAREEYQDECDVVHHRTLTLPTGSCSCEKPVACLLQLPLLVEPAQPLNDVIIA